MSTDICGLYFLVPSEYGYPQRKYLPQIGIKSHTTISATLYTTKLKQTFINPSAEKQTQATYAFPLYDGVTVTSFTCSIGEREVVGHVEEKQQALQTYQDAVDRGESAGLLESLPAGIFSISVGGIPPKSNIVVDLEYGGELKHDAQIDGIRYTLPLSVAPRYGDYPGEVLQAELDSAQERGIQIDVDFDLHPLIIKTLRTTSSAFQPLLSTHFNTPQNGRTLAGSASVHLTGSEMEQDFVLLAEVNGIGTPQASVEIEESCNTTMATFVPKFKLPNIRPEIVFVADQSGSMGGSKTNSLIDALTVFLKSLPNDVHFNICAFGTRHEFVFDKSQIYNSKNVTKALNFVKTFGAQYGGTELQTPIEETFERHKGDRPLEVIVISDGEIWQEQELFDFINEKIVDEGVDARVFGLGIGSDVSHTLVEGIARAGRGVAQFVTDEENLDHKVIRMLKSALSPHFKNVKVNLNYGDNDDDDDFEMVDGKEATREEKSAIVVPVVNDEKVSTSLFDTSANLDEPIPNSDAEILSNAKVDIEPFTFTTPSFIPLFPFNRTTVYCMTPPTASPPSTLTLTAESSTGPLSLEIPITSKPTSSGTARKLAARTYIHDLEAGRCPPSLKINTTSPSSQKAVLQSAITVLGTTHQVPSKYTSYVAVEDKYTSTPDNQTDTCSSVQHNQPDSTSRSSFRPSFSPFTNRSRKAKMSRAGGSRQQYPPMSAIPPPPPQAMFGAPASSTGAMPRSGQFSSVFGGAIISAPSTSPFGAASGSSLMAMSGPPAPSPASSVSAFGSSAPVGSAFGSSSSTSPAGASLFGSATGGSSSARGGLFGSLRSVGSSSGGLFGSATSTSGHQQPPLQQQMMGQQRQMAQQPVQQQLLQQQQQMPGQWQSAPKEDVIDVLALSEEQRLRIIIREQSFEGSWGWSEKLIKVLMGPQSNVRGSSDTIITTILVMEALKTNFSRLEEIWELCADKAEAWLAGNVDAERRTRLTNRIQTESFASQG